MLSTLFSFISPVTGQAKLVILAILAAVMVSLFGVVYYYKTSYETELSKVATLKAEYSQTTDELKTCSDNVQKISDESVTKINEAKKAMEQATVNTKTHQAKASIILVTKPSSNNACDSALDLFKSYMVKEPK